MCEAAQLDIRTEDDNGEFSLATASSKGIRVQGLIGDISVEM